MDTLRNYVDSIFADLPKTAEMLRQKQELLDRMQQRFDQLKAEGKSEHEAIGMVFAELGDVDAIRAAAAAGTPEDVPEAGAGMTNEQQVFLSPEQVDEYIDHRHRFAWAMATGVFLCIMGPASMFLGQYLVESYFRRAGRSSDLVGVLTMVPLFVLIAAGVALFILFGMREEQFELENKRVQLDSTTYARLKAEHKAFRPRLATAVAIGVALCILAPVSMLLAVVLLGENNGLSLVFLLSFIAIGVFLFIYFGTQNETYEKLLAIGEFAKDKAEENKVVGIVAGVVFPLAAAVYLIAGFVYYAWATAWIIFPIVGILFGIFATVYNGYMDLKKKK
jgi:MFS family permease